MTDKELIEQYRKIVKPVVASWLFNINYEHMGEQDREEFERDFDKILDLALIGLKYKAQLSQEETNMSEFPNSSTLQLTCNQLATDCISRQAAIDAMWHTIEGEMLGELEGYANAVIEDAENAINALPSAQPERKTGHWIRVAGMNECCSACNKYFPLSSFTGRPFDINYCPNCGADMRGEQNG